MYMDHNITTIQGLASQCSVTVTTHWREYIYIYILISYWSKPMVLYLKTIALKVINPHPPNHWASSSFLFGLAKGFLLT